MIIIAEMFFTELEAVTAEGGGGGGGATARFGPLEALLLSSIDCFGGGGGFTFGGLGDGRGCTAFDRELLCELERCKADPRFCPPVGGSGACPLCAGILESVLLTAL